MIIELQQQEYSLELNVSTLTSSSAIMKGGATIQAIYKMRNITSKLTRVKNQLTFLSRCKAQGFRIRLPIQSYNMSTLSKKVSFKVLNESIGQAHKKQSYLWKSKQELQQCLLRMLDQQQYREMETWIMQHEETTYKQCKERHQKKLDRLILECQGQLKQKKVVHNYSSCNLDKIEEEVLSL